MDQPPLISIIIPTYNRAHLLGETLDSILSQTYQNWECIVVDDGSTDITKEVITKYLTKDFRFRYYERPLNKPKGANACRNYGLQKSNGEYINFFDSDDLMGPEFLVRKLEVLEQENVDFVVSQSLNFDEKGTYRIKKYKGNSQFELTGKNYIFNKVYWLTPDFLIKADQLKGYSFNELLKSGQETNFFIVFLNTNPQLKGIAIDEHLTYRRLHRSSIQQSLKVSKSDAFHGKLYSLLLAYNQVHKKLDSETKHFMQAEIMKIFYELKLKKEIRKETLNFTANLILNGNPLKALAFYSSLVLKTYFNAGYKLFEFARS